jgi:hypothetical protein
MFNHLSRGIGLGAGLLSRAAIGLPIWTMEATGTILDLRRPYCFALSSSQAATRVGAEALAVAGAVGPDPRYTPWCPAGAVRTDVEVAA